MRKIYLAIIFILVLGLILIFALIFNNNKNEEITDERYKVNNLYQEGYYYNYYLPSNYNSDNPTPLFVILHGGTQSADIIAKTTKMNELAEEYNFIVLYPQQSVTANPRLYWNWFLEQNQVREGGELEIIAGMILKIISEYNIDQEKIFTAGLSAGASMALSLGINYPDLISGVGMAAGLGYATANERNSALNAMAGNLPDVDNTSTKAYQNMPEQSRHIFKTIVFHGDIDYTVNVENAHYIITQMAHLNDLIDDGLSNHSFTDTPSLVQELVNENGVNYTLSSYNDSHNNVIMKKYIIENMGHAWPGGSNLGTYAQPLAPDMSLLMYKFFMDIE